MSVLVFADSTNGALAKSAYEAVSYGKQVANGGELTVVVGGACSNVAELGQYGADKILHCGDDSLNSSDPQIVTALIAAAQNASGANVIVMSHDYTGKGVAPRIAARLKAGLVSGAVALPDTTNSFTVKKAVFSGKAFANVSITSDIKVVSVLPNSVGKVENAGAGTVEPFSADLGSTGVTVKEVKKESSELSLTEADMVVSAGRGLKGPENWGIVEELAKELGAATACSRPVADIGWRPHHEHVGQTGIAIRPNLYIAAGISGAIQHLAGVNGSKVIVVINTDDEAPFFKAADYGIVGDAFEVLPKLTEAVRNFKAANN